MKIHFPSSHYRSKFTEHSLFWKSVNFSPQLSKISFACLDRVDEQLSLPSQQNLRQYLYVKDTLQEDQLNRPVSLTLKSFGVA